jgi:hypothetical protein
MVIACHPVGTSPIASWSLPGFGVSAPAEGSGNVNAIGVFTGAGQAIKSGAGSINAIGVFTGVGPENNCSVYANVYQLILGEVYCPEIEAVCSLYGNVYQNTYGDVFCPVGPAPSGRILYHHYYLLKGK